MEYVQLATSHFSSVKRHQALSRPRKKSEFLAHLKDWHAGEQAFD
jgi:hypothetical protein